MPVRARFEIFYLGFFLPKTRGKSDVRQSILDYIKTFISNIDAVRNLDVTIKKRVVWVENKDFSIFFDARRSFKMGYATSDEKHLVTLNNIMNQVCEKLNQMDKEKAKSEIVLISTLSSELRGRDRYKTISRLVKEEALQELSQEAMNFAPIQVRVSTKRENWRKSGRMARFNLTVEEKKTLLNVDLLNRYKRQFPIDITGKAIRDSKELLDKILKTLR